MKKFFMLTALSLFSASQITSFGAEEQKSVKAAKEEIKEESTHKSLMLESVTALEQMVTLIEGVKDEKTANAALPKMEKLGEQMKALQSKAIKLGQPSAEMQETLKAEFETKMMGLIQRLMSASMKLQTLPEATKQKIMQAMQKMQGM